jgi:glycosyltransferase involved in cell wall biosynthesis
MSTVGLNAQLLNLSASYRGAGIHRFIHHLLSELPAAAPQYRYVTFLNDSRMASPAPAMQMRHTRWHTQNPIARIAWEQTALPLAAFTERLDLLHALAFARPVLARCPIVLTIYDMSFVRMPERFPAFQRRYLQLMTRYSARHAAAITVISQSTKNDVVEFYGIAPERIQVVYCGVDEQFRQLAAAEIEEFRASKGLPARYILYLGTLEPRKNVAQLVRAFAALPPAGRPKLVIAGAKGWGYADLFAAAEQSGIRSDIIFPGYVAQQELPLWYNAAELFVYPSHYEGFGLPLAEAMACGTPSITSNVSSLPEVAGHAALTVAPADTQGLTDAIERVLSDAQLRAQLKERGVAQAAQFTWRRVAEQTAQVYARVLKRHAS